MYIHAPGSNAVTDTVCTTVPQQFPVIISCTSKPRKTSQGGVREEQIKTQIILQPHIQFFSCIINRSPALINSKSNRRMKRVFLRSLDRCFVDAATGTTSKPHRTRSPSRTPLATFVKQARCRVMARLVCRLSGDLTAGQLRKSYQG